MIIRDGGANMGRWRDYLYNKDERIFFYFNQKIRCRLLDIVMPRITHLGGAVFTIALCATMYVFGEGPIRSAAQDAIISISGSQGLVQLGKNLISRQRPYLVLPEVNTLWSHMLKDYSFPSGHTTTGFSLAVILAQHFPGFGYIAYALAALVGVSRMYVGMHYPSDVITGAFLGSAISLLTRTLRAA